MSATADSLIVDLDMVAVGSDVERGVLDLARAMLRAQADKVAELEGERDLVLVRARTAATVDVASPIEAFDIVERAMVDLTRQKSEAMAQLDRATRPKPKSVPLGQPLVLGGSHPWSHIQSELEAAQARNAELALEVVGLKKTGISPRRITSDTPDSVRVWIAPVKKWLGQWLRLYKDDDGVWCKPGSGMPLDVQPEWYLPELPAPEDWPAAQPRPRSMESAPRDGEEVHDWVDEDGFDVCSQCGSYANDKLTDVCDSTTTDEQAKS